MFIFCGLIICSNMLSSDQNLLFNLVYIKGIWSTLTTAVQGTEYGSRYFNINDYIIEQSVCLPGI